MTRMHPSQVYSILYVDDEEKTLKYFSRFFSKDYTVLTAKNTSEAKAILDSNADEIGLLITDQRMPVEKGVELLKYSREKYPYIIRLLTTAYSDLGDAIEAVNRGEILRYIPKPWDINFLELEIRHAMRFFALNKEREQLRNEKLSVIQRVTVINQVKDLIILSAGLSHLRNTLHAIRAYLLQLPDNIMASMQSPHNDLWELMKSEIEDIFILAGDIHKYTAVNNPLNFEQLDIPEILSKVCENIQVRASYNIDSGTSPIEANSELIRTLLRISLELLTAKSSGENTGIRVTVNVDNGKLQIRFETEHRDGNFPTHEISAQLLSAYYICYHHGGGIDITDVITITLPVSQKDFDMPELEQRWQEEIFNRFEMLPV